VGGFGGYGGADRGVHVYVHERIEQGKVEKGFYLDLKWESETPPFHVLFCVFPTGRGGKRSCCFDEKKAFLARSLLP
jgi:hypothetical protein